MTKSSSFSFLADQVKVARFCCACCVLTIGTCGFIVWRTSAAYERKSQVIVVDSTGYYLSRTLDFTAATYLHESQVYNAAETLLNRGPLGPDNPERLKRLFGEEACLRAARLMRADAQEFQAKEIHQKVELGEVQLVQVKDESVLATFSGQLIRSGMFGGKPFVEVLAVNGRITFSRNPDIVANGAFPTVVRTFEVEIQPVLPQ